MFLKGKQLPSVAFGVINGNYALSAKITDKCLATESSDSSTAMELANVIAVKTTSLNYEWVKVIKKVFSSSAMREVVNQMYGSAVKAVF